MSNFASQSLKWLRVVDVDFIARSVPPALFISAPSVENLEFKVHTDRGIAFTLRDMPKATWANISVMFCYEAHRYTSDLLNGLSNVLDLEIECFCLKVYVELFLFARINVGFN